MAKMVLFKIEHIFVKQHEKNLRSSFSILGRFEKNPSNDIFTFRISNVRIGFFVLYFLCAGGLCCIPFSPDSTIISQVSLNTRQYRIQYLFQETA
jgi:hypothetical protein